jgi:hypothetical protein
MPYCLKKVTIKLYVSSELVAGGLIMDNFPIIHLSKAYHCAILTSSIFLSPQSYGEEYLSVTSMFVCGFSVQLAYVPKQIVRLLDEYQVYEVKR